MAKLIIDVDLRDSAARAEVEKLQQALDRLTQKKSINVDGGSMKDISAAGEELLNRVEKLTGIKREASEINAETSAFAKNLSEGGDTLDHVVGKVTMWGIATTAVYGTFKLIKTAISDISHTLQEVEDETIGLQRVLNTDVSGSAIADELIGIAREFGNARSDVAEVATTWAQAGYEWNDVLSLTRGTMLALNTAELDLSQSTSDLIAVMKQYKIEVEDYPELIDLINYTADNYAVTSEKIVAALQKTGSTLAGYNVSLEQSIALTTGLSEATGASGRMIGNALKSLTTYTTKGGALDIFASLDDEIAEVISKYQAGAASVYDIWEQLSVSMKDLNMQQTQTLESWFNSEDYQGFADELEAEATDITNTITDIYGTAGTYRKNYFIALLNNFDTVQKALDDMAEASGHSLGEQEKYAQSYTAKVNQLRAAWESLVVAEDGWLDIMKGLVEFLTKISDFVGDIGGLKVALSGIVGIVLTLGSGKILSFLDTFKKFLGLKEWKDLPVVIKMLGAELKAFFVVGEMSVQAALTWIGIATTLITVIVGAANAIKNAQHEARMAAIEAGEAATKEAEDLTNLYGAYMMAADGSEEAATAFKALADALNLEGDEVEDLTAKYKEMIAVKEADARLAVRAAGQELESSARGLFNNAFTASYSRSGVSADVQARIAAIGALRWNNDADIMSLSPTGRSAEELAKYLDNVRELIVYIGKKNDAEEADLRLAEQLQKVYDRNRETVEAYRSAVESELNVGANSIFNVMYLDEIAQGGQEAFDRIAAAIKTDTSMTEEWRDALLNVMQNVFPELADQTQVLEAMTGGITAQQRAFNEYAESLTALENQYKLLTGAQEELNEKGSISAKTFQQIIDNGLLGYLENTEDGLRINTEALLNSAESAKEKALADLQAGLAADILKLAERDVNEEIEESTTASSNAAGAASMLADALGSVAPAALTAASALKFYNSLGQTSGTLEGKESEIDRLVGQYRDAAAKINSISIDMGGSSGKSGGSSGKGKTLAEIKREELDDWLNDTKHTIFLLEKAEGDHNDKIVALYREMQKRTHETANYFRSLGYGETDKEIQELQKLWWGYEDEIQKVYDAAAKDAAKALEEIEKKQKDLLDELKDAADDTLEDYSNWVDEQNEALDEEIDALKEQQAIYDDRINALKEAREIQQDQDKLAEHQLKVEEARLAVLEAEENLRKAQNERTVRYYNARTGEWGWMADQKAVQSAQDALNSARGNFANAQGALSSYLDDVAYNEAVKALEAEKSLIDDQIDLIKKQQDYNRQQYEAFSDEWKRLLGTLETPARAIGEILSEIAGLPGMAGFAGDFGNILARMDASQDSGEMPLKIIKPLKSFDRGGFAKGKGVLPKDTFSTEIVLDPQTTSAILTPITDGNYERVRDFLQLSAGLADSLRYAPDMTTSGGMGSIGGADNRKIYYFNGVKIGASEAERNSLAEIARMLTTDLPLV